MQEIGHCKCPQVVCEELTVAGEQADVSRASCLHRSLALLTSEGRGSLPWPGMLAGQVSVNSSPRGPTPQPRRGERGHEDLAQGEEREATRTLPKGRRERPRGPCPRGGADSHRSGPPRLPALVLKAHSLSQSLGCIPEKIPGRATSTVCPQPPQQKTRGQSLTRHMPACPLPPPRHAVMRTTCCKTKPGREEQPGSPGNSCRDSSRLAGHRWEARGRAGPLQPGPGQGPQHSVLPQAPRPGKGKRELTPVSYKRASCTVLPASLR